MLVENFPQTYFVGGMVRDLLLKKKITDIDIATQAEPDSVIGILKENNVSFQSLNQNFGAVTAQKGNFKIEITTFRKDLKSLNRYPRVKFVKDIKLDSNRRDFTVNALYLSPNSNKILDFHNGLADLKSRKIKFIGNPVTRITEDPLRIIRALRFALVLNFNLEKRTRTAIKNNWDRLRLITESRTKKEIDKIKDVRKKNFLRRMLDSNVFLDKII